MEEYSNIRYAVDSFLMLQERTIRRQWITIILLILIAVGSNMAWLYRESQFTDEVVTTQEITQDLDAEGCNTRLLSYNSHEAQNHLYLPEV